MLDLADILVVTLEQAVAAPYCSCRLADAGARVIKIERQEGDFARGYDSVVDGQSAYFVWLNRGKESLVLNIKDAEDAALTHRILAKADVFIQNLAPGAAARSGLGSRSLRKLYPQLICCNISGYGEQGEYRDMKAYDLLVQCESGLTSITGTPDAPGRVGVSICDISCGQQAYSAILEALIERQHSGEGCVVDVSLFDSIVEWMAVPLLHYDYAGTIQPRVGNNHATISPYGAYRSRDNLDVVLAIQNEREWKRFCADVLEQPELPDDERLRSNAQRVAHRELVDQTINGVFSQLDGEAIIDRLNRAGIAYGRLNDIAGLSKHPQLRKLRVKTESGEASVAAVAAIRSNQVSEIRTVPAIGEQSHSIRSEFS
ncbi:MAG: CaiB/BaiF CoA-transferase family protein [Gammaproteobacteria bacterium]|nr:CaiB/BaiF CoA-transferase family protein [Gammaproteobacteria bacterium]